MLHAHLKVNHYTHLCISTGSEAKAEQTTLSVSLGRLSNGSSVLTLIHWISNLMFTGASATIIIPCHLYSDSANTIQSLPGLFQKSRTLPNHVIAFFIKGSRCRLLMSSSCHSLRIFWENPTRSLTILGEMHNTETSGQLREWKKSDKVQLSAMLLGRSPELGIWAFTERRLPTIDEAFLSLDIRAATFIERLNITRNGGNVGARRGRFLTVGKQPASVDSWQTALPLIFYRRRD